MKYIKKNILDNMLIFNIIFLLLFGYIMTSSSSIFISEKLYNNNFFISNKKLLFTIISFFIFLIIINIPIKILKYYSTKIFILNTTLLLIFTIIKKINKFKRWIKIGILTFQPSEIYKILIFLYIAKYLEKNANNIKKKPFIIFKPISLIIFITYLTIIKNDLGTFILINFTNLSLLFIIKQKIIFHIFALIIILTTILLSIINKPYRINRVLSYINPHNDALNKNYQIIQSMIALKNGNILGKGIGNSIQKIKCLPEPHTDFIFSIIIEELGIFGSLCLLISILIIYLKIRKISKKSFNKKKIFSGILSYLISFNFIIQIIINIGSNISLLPIKGLTLPLISYGGSSLISIIIIISILLKIDFENKLNKNNV